jgi:TolB-like protein
MSDVFISYARATELQAAWAVEALRARGFSVWRDDEIPAHRSYTDVIEERLRAARAVIVLWSTEAAHSQWVRAEANVAREAGRLVQARLDGCTLPLPFNEIQCADCTAWDGDPAHFGWLKVVQSIESLVATETTDAAPAPAPVAAPVRPIAPGPVAAQAPERLLAVLPFDNLSGDPDTGYFSDGVSEEILHTVSRCRGLKVIGKASSFQFRGTDKATSRIVSELRATHILDGSVRRAGERIRVSAQLVDTATHATLWTDRFDRSLTDIFALQDEIAAAIADALDAHFTPGKAQGGVNPEAYDLYLKARAAYDQDARQVDRERCVSLLEQSVALAPDFAMAWGQLALYRGLALPKESEAAGELLRPTIRREADRARSLDPDCGPASTALALLIPAYSGYAERIRLAGRGYALAPSDSSVGHLYAGSLLATGRNREACSVFDELVVREPGSPYSHSVRAFFYLTAGEPETALALARQTVANFPSFIYPRYMLEQIERGAAALSTSRNAEDRAAAVSRLERMMDDAAPVSHVIHASRLARLGEADRAYGWLFAAIDAGRPLSIDVAPDGRGFSRTLASIVLFSPVSSALRADPRFAELAVRVGLADYWRESGHWPDCTAGLPYDLKAACQAADGKGLPRYREAVPQAG